MTGSSGGLLYHTGVGMSFWGLAARFSLSFPVPRGRVSAGRLPCSFVLVFWLGDKRCHCSVVCCPCVLSLCVVPAAQAGQCPFQLVLEVSPNHCPGQAVPSSSPGVGCPASAATDHHYSCMSWAHARCLHQRRMGLSFESPDDSLHLL